MLRIRISAAALGTGLAIAGLALIAPLAAAQSRPAATEPLALSLDGVHFDDGVSPRLFSALGAVVPGDTSSAAVWIRNDARDRATLSVDLVDVAASDRELASAASLKVSAAGRERVVTVAEAHTAGGRIRALDALPLAPSETVRVDVTLAIDARLGERRGEPGVAGARETFSLRVQAALAQSPVTAGTRALPATGGGDPRLGIAGGALCASGTGVLVMALRKRDRCAGKPRVAPCRRREGVSHSVQTTQGHN